MTLNLFQPLTGLYEPSAIQQLPDGRFLVVEDEKQHPFSLLSIAPDGSVASVPLTPDGGASDDGVGKLNDLEGLALDRAGHLYSITSHSRDGDGEQKKSRDRLVRFRVEAQRILAPVVVDGLKPALLAAHPVLAEAAAIRDVKRGGGLNIEALEMTPDQQRLLLGFRGPLVDGRAIVCAVERLAELFDQASTASAPPRIAPDLILLDLAGHGIRGMCYVDALGGYLVIGGPVGRQPEPFALWFWTGATDAPARRVTLPGALDLARAEGLCPALIDGQPRLLVVSDDGSRSEGRCARFMLLDPGALQISP